jgi:hypothetical protein
MAKMDSSGELLTNSLRLAHTPLPAIFAFSFSRPTSNKRLI